MGREGKKGRAGRGEKRNWRSKKEGREVKKSAWEIEKVQRETEKNPPNKAAGTGKGAEKRRQIVKKTGITAKQN